MWNFDRLPEQHVGPTFSVHRAGRSSYAPDDVSQKPVLPDLAKALGCDRFAA